jgi:two-component sensor histidine kinase
VVSGSDIPLSANAVSALALLIHEFTTNAAKYGSLSTQEGRVSIDCVENGDQFVLIWKEWNGPKLDGHRGEDGFGSLMTRAAAQGQLGGTITRDWSADGLIIRLSMSRERLDG